MNRPNGQRQRQRGQIMGVDRKRGGEERQGKVGWLHPDAPAILRGKNKHRVQ